jgi:hypothetical protein
MNNILRGLSYLLVLYFELAIVIVVGVFGGRYLDNHYPAPFRWVLVSTAISVVLCIYLPYSFLVKIIKQESQKSPKKALQKEPED